MTTVRDFESPERAPTLQVSSGDGAGDTHTPLSPVLPPPRSPLSPGRHSLHRQASGGSRLSVPETIDTLRHRKPSRSNTVTTYHHEPEIHDASSWQPGAEPGVDTSAEDDKIPPHLIKLKTECDINVIDFSDQASPIRITVSLICANATISEHS